MATTTTKSRLPNLTSSDPPPPKSKSQPYYSILPSWSDVIPIPQVDLDIPSTYTTTTTTTTSPPPPSLSTQQPQHTPSQATTLATAGPALATIAYAPRYAEAMSYLRAVMADNEFSVRALNLTEDIIGMNPAHYTVWIYRLRCLRVLWGVDGDGTRDGGVDEEEKQSRIVEGVQSELEWLEAVSERNLKNYQIWHHRTSLLSLLPTLPPTEPTFLSHILSFDTKNYHVWSYRQWLCTRFPDPLLTTSMELDAVETMIAQDVMNNSAWNHRWFVVVGSREVISLQQQQSQASQKQDGAKTKDSTASSATKVVDLDVIEREITYTQKQIRLAPQNGASWNYLKGILKYSGAPVGEMKGFCAEFVGRGFDFFAREEDTFASSSQGQRSDGDEEGKKIVVRSSQAIEMLIDIFAVETLDGSSRVEAREKVREGIRSLSELWDPVRRNYWAYKLKGLEEGWKEG